MLAANLLTFAALLPLVGRLAGTARADAVALPSLSLGRALPFCTAYAGFVLFNNADVFVAYLMLNATDLGAYSAAAVLPKAIVTATQPVANIVLPILVSLGEEGRRTRQAVVKGIAVTGILAALGAGVLWLGSDAVCGGRFGIRFCSAGPMLVLAAGSIGLSMARVSIAADLGRGRYWLAHLPLAACAAFVALGLASRADVPALASRYALTAMAVLAIMAAVKAARL
jgi:O-antigen/teichoic acid export membrane protein